MFDSSDGSDETGVCAGSSDHSLLVDGISTIVYECQSVHNVGYQHLRHNEHFDIRKRVSKINDEIELASLWSANETTFFKKIKNLMEFLNINPVIRQSYAA